LAGVDGRQGATIRIGAMSDRHHGSEVLRWRVGGDVASAAQEQSAIGAQDVDGFARLLFDLLDGTVT
jgi:hypothetical protein